MDRRSGLKKAHFSSVPTRMSLFTCKKYVFLIEKNFPNLIASTPPKDRENSATLSYGSRWKTQQRFPMGRVGKLSNAFLWVALENSATLSYGSRWKTQQRFPMGRVGKLSNAFLWVALENSTQRSL
ncbi:hypothetical protein LEP1GSC077_2529 [Leptospira interrogans str. C10069]|nr:hypothetical protein LEP1GSC077_2529 [Leptospira interrogans str. C10069]